MRRFYLFAFSILFALSAWADSPLPVDRAFIPTVQVISPHKLQLNITMSPGTSIYQESIHVVLAPVGLVALNPIKLPATSDYKVGPDGKNKLVYHGRLTLPLVLSDLNGDTFSLNLSYQGCQDSGICYPPQTRDFAINLSPPYGKHLSPQPAEPPLSPPLSDTPHSRSLPFMLVSYFFLGLLMAFTPCVLPMLPIVAGIVMGKEKSNRSRGMRLALSYVLGMAITYAIAGVLVATLGANLDSFWQQPWLVAVFAAVFVVMALSLFDIYQIQMPARLQTKLSNMSNQQRPGKLAGAFVMGVLSTLILSPCMTPALVGALTYITQTGSWVIGGSALFLMGLGIGVPLLLIGWLGQTALHKMGPWLATIKTALGILMLGMAVFLLSRILPPFITQIAWAALSIGTGVALFRAKIGKTKTGKISSKVLTVLFILGGIALWTQAEMANKNPISASHQTETIRTLDQLQAAISRAGPRPIMLEFNANWCLACKIVEKRVLSKPMIKKELSTFVLLQVDLTKTTPATQAIMRKWRVFGPPTFIFIRNGKEVAKTRLVGEISIKDLQDALARVT